MMWLLLREEEHFEGFFGSRKKLGEKVRDETKMTKGLYFEAKKEMVKDAHPVTKRNESGKEER